MTPARSHSRPVYSYTRLSSAEQMKGTGLTRQLSMAEDYCARHGLTLSTQTFRDLGVSGYTGKNIKTGALGRFISLVEKGRIPNNAILLIEQLDRYTRLDPLQGANELQRLLKLGVEVHTLTDGRVFTKDSLKDIGSLFYSLAVLHRAYDESKTKSERGRSNWTIKRKLAAPGKLHTRMAPGWLSWDGESWAVDPAKARTVVRVFEMAAEGHGVEFIARRLNETKVSPPTRRATAWHGSTVFKLLHSPAVIGTLQVGHRENKEDGAWSRVIDSEVEDYYPAVVSKRLWLKTRKNARPVPPSGPKSDNLFSSLLVCGACRSPMHLHNRGKGRNGGHYVMCRRAKRGLCTSGRGWKYQRLESLLIELLHRCIRWETLTAASQKAHTSALTQLEEQLAAVEVERESNALRLQRITEAIEAGAKVATLMDRMTALDTSRTALEQRAVELRGRVEGERERVRSVRADVQESKAAFADWQTGKLKTDPTARHRLGVVLRRMLSKIVLATPETGRGPAMEARRIEVAFRDTNEAPEAFRVSPDLLAVYDEEGEEVVKVKGVGRALGSGDAHDGP